MYAIRSYYDTCMARRRYMPSLIDIEISPFSKIATTVGFFTYGEFFHNKENNELLNQTLTVLSLSEADEIKENNKNEVLENDEELSEYARSFVITSYSIHYTKLYDRHRW